MADPADRRRTRWLATLAIGALVCGVIGDASAVRAGRKAKRAARAAAAAGPDPRVLAVTVGSGRAYLARTRELLIASIEDPSRPRPLGTLELPFTARRLSLDGTLLYVAAETHGLVVVDVADPALPRIVWAHDDYARVRHALPIGDHLLLAAHRDGLHVVDVSRPQRPRRVARVSSGGELSALSLEGARLATAEGQAGVRLFDVTHAERPREAGRWTRSATGAIDVELVGERIWVAAGRRGLLVLDASHDERLLFEVDLGAPVHRLVRSGVRMLALTSRGAYVLPLDDPRATPLELELPRRPALADAALDETLVVLALDTGWALVELLEDDGSRLRWPAARRLRVTFD